MNILIIGNGFDLAHGLPTKYEDFLDFCYAIEYICDREISIYPENIDNIEEKIEEIKINNNVKPVVSRVFRKDLSEFCYTKVISKIYSYLKENAWFKYFMRIRNQGLMVGKNWIDFESEISKVIQQIRKIRNYYDDDEKIKNGFVNWESYKDADVLFSCMNMHEVFPNLKTDNESGLTKFMIFNSSSIGSVENVDIILNILLRDLNEITRVLEIYIDAGINNVTLSSNNKVKDFRNINPDHVLSFNYSNTYNRLYDQVGEDETCHIHDKTCYIHGKANVFHTLENCNLVLGIDEFLHGKKKDRELEYLPFKKFYQRIYKSPDNEYLDWVDEIKDGYADYIKRQQNNIYAYEQSKRDGSITQPFQMQKFEEAFNEKMPKHTVYIFGHSLDVTDKDVLKLFICNDNVETKIYYHRKNRDDREDLGKKIKNLIKIMGQEELIRRTGGAHKTIEFIPQTLTAD